MTRVCRLQRAQCTGTTSCRPWRPPVGLLGRGSRIGRTGVEVAIVVGVEYMRKRLHVALGGGVPVGEHHFVALGDLAIVADIEDQHAVARSPHAVRCWRPSPAMSKNMLDDASGVILMPSPSRSRMTG